MTITTKNTTDHINRMSADNRVTSNEIKSLSTSVIRDLVAAEDGEVMMNQLVENLELFSKHLGMALAGDGPGPKPTSRMVPSNVYDIADYLSDIIEELDQFGVAGTFMAGLGLAQSDGRITVREMQAIDKLADTILEQASDKGGGSSGFAQSHRVYGGPNNLQRWGASLRRDESHR